MEVKKELYHHFQPHFEGLASIVVLRRVKIQITIHITYNRKVTSKEDELRLNATTIETVTHHKMEDMGKDQIKGKNGKR